jgi:predicted permease
VVAELAFSVGLLVAAGLMVRGMLNLRTLDFDFRTAEVFTARIGLFETAYPTPEERWEFYRELQDRLEARPEIRSAALTSVLPGLFGEGTNIGIQGAAYENDQDYPSTRFAAISPGFFETMGVEVQAGRDFTVADDVDAPPVAVVNRSFAQQYFSGENPVGRQIRMGTAESQEPWLTVVGVVPDMYLQGVGNDDPSQSGYYVPLAQANRRFVNVAAVGPPIPLSLTPVVQEEVGQLNADTPLYWARTLERSIRLNNWQVDIFGGLFAVFGFLALLLAAAGLYAVMATGVAQRTREMGVRMALGAGAPQLLRMVLRQGAIQLSIGLGLGFLLAAGLSRGLRAALFGVEPWDPTVFSAVAVIMLISGLAASLLPALRATRVDPVEALRTD